VGWRIATHATIGFKLQVTATPGFHSLYDWCLQMMWLFSGVPENPEGETLMEMHGTDALYSAVKRLMHAIRPADEEAQQDAAHRMIQIAKPWTIQTWSESKLAKEKPVVPIPKEHTHLVDLEWSEDEQAPLKTLLERDSSRGASGVWMNHRWRLAGCAFVLGDTEDRNDVSGQSYYECPLHPWMDSPIFRLLRDTFLPMLVNEPAENSEPDEDDASNKVLLSEPESNKCALSPATPPQRRSYFVRWLAKFVI
jgi:hypothetical protein